LPWLVASNPAIKSFPASDFITYPSAPAFRDAVTMLAESWWLNISIFESGETWSMRGAAPSPELTIGGETFRGTAQFLSNRTEHERAMTAIRRKYWMFRPIIELGRILSAIGLMRDNTGSFEVALAG
jgi:hypothetical protein